MILTVGSCGNHLIAEDDMAPETLKNLKVSLDTWKRAKQLCLDLGLTQAGLVETALNALDLSMSTQVVQSGPAHKDPRLNTSDKLRVIDDKNARWHTLLELTLEAGIGPFREAITRNLEAFAIASKAVLESGNSSTPPALPKDYSGLLREVIRLIERKTEDSERDTGASEQRA